jgi:hypothetical protein
MASETTTTTTAEGGEAVADPTLATFTLDNILGHEHDKIENSHAEGWDEESADKSPADGYCIECEGKSEGTMWLVHATD